MGEDDAREIGYLVMAAVGMVAAVRLWETKVRPWVEQYLHLGAGEHQPLVTLGPISWTKADVIGIAALAAIVLVLVGLLRSAVRRRRHRRRQEQDGRRRHLQAVPTDRDELDDEW